jgi:hypothetical protein
MMFFHGMCYLDEDLDEQSVCWVWYPTYPRWNGSAFAISDDFWQFSVPGAALRSFNVTAAYEARPILWRMAFERLTGHDVEAPMPEAIRREFILFLRHEIGLCDDKITDELTEVAARCVVNQFSQEGGTHDWLHEGF